MADPITLIGGVAAGLQLVSAAAEALLATIKLMKDLKEVPGRLASLLNDVDDSISRLCYSCNSGFKTIQKLGRPQTERLSKCTIALQAAIQDINNMIAPLFANDQGKIKPARQLWNALVSLKVEKELPRKLQRMNRLNIEVIRELGFIGLETNMTTQELVMTSNKASSQGFTNIEAKMDAIQDEIRQFTLSVQQAQSGSSKNGYPIVTASRVSTSSSSTVFEATIQTQGLPQEAVVSDERAEQIRRYLAGATGDCTIAGPREMSPSKLPSANLDYILVSIRTFYTPGNFVSTSSVKRTKFWEDIDLGIYLMKVSQGQQRGASQSRTRGNQILKKSTASPFNNLNEASATILIEVLSTLSPVNTTTCPYVREGMLKYLDELARTQFSRNHPITLVIEKLRHDDGDKNVTLRALEFLIDRLRATLDPIHPLTQLGTYRLCGLLRRSGDYDGAIRVACDGIRAIRALLGTGSLPERRLSRQLEHVYMDRCEWTNALSVCFDIVGQKQFNWGNPDPQHHDECAVTTMEDIAKACECGGNVELAIAWLKQAIISHGMTLGQTNALDHVHDKLGELLKQTGKDEELALWTPALDL